MCWRHVDGIQKQVRHHHHHHHHHYNQAMIVKPTLVCRHIQLDPSLAFHIQYITISVSLAVANQTLAQLRLNKHSPQGKPWRYYIFK